VARVGSAHHRQEGTRCQRAPTTLALGTEAALRGILALLVAERQDQGIERAEQILGRAGLGDEQIASLTGRDANQVRAIGRQLTFARAAALNGTERDALTIARS